MRLIPSALAGAALALMAGAASAALPAGLSVRVLADSAVVTGDRDVTVTVEVSNPTASTLSALRWDLPGARHDSALFQISRDGEAVAYTGRLMKRAAPLRTDYVRFAPGSVQRYTVELSSGYDMARDGSYSVQFGHSDPVSATVVSQPLYLSLQARSGVGARAADGSLLAGGGASAVSAPTYNGCSTSQISTVGTAITNAINYATGARNWFAAANYATERFTWWFGPGNRNSATTVKRNYDAIHSAFTTRQLSFDCTCSDAGVFAYVYPSQPYTIYLCPVFWQTTDLGTDSRAGTLIHEMSHFTAVAGTSDYAYGQTAAHNLALTNPSRAIRNADSHEYFAENTPARP